MTERPLEVGEIGMLCNFVEYGAHLNGIPAEVIGRLGNYMVEDLAYGTESIQFGYLIENPIDPQFTFCSQNRIIRLADPDEELETEEEKIVNT